AFAVRCRAPPHGALIRRTAQSFSARRNASPHGAMRQRMVQGFASQRKTSRRDTGRFIATQRVVARRRIGLLGKQLARSLGQVKWLVVLATASRVDDLRPPRD